MIIFKNRYSKKGILTVMIVCAFSISSKSQSEIGFEGTYIFGFQGRQIQIEDEIVFDYKATGAQVFANYQKKLGNSPWSIKSGIGTKFISISGATYSASRITGSAVRVNLLIGTNFLIQEKLNIGLNIITENNRDMEDFLDGKSDLWRYYMGIESSYILSEKLALVARFSRILHPNVDLYLLLNPANQFSIGFNFKIK